MAESYPAALKGVLSSLQSSCRSENSDNIKKCKRAMEERIVINEVALSLDKPSQTWRSRELAKVKSCYHECQINGKHEVRECNTLCLNSLIQGVWGRINLAEYDQIASKYA